MNVGQFSMFVNALHKTHNDKAYGSICLCEMCLATAKFAKHYEVWDDALRDIGIYCKVN